MSNKSQPPSSSSSSSSSTPKPTLKPLAKFIYRTPIAPSVQLKRSKHIANKLDVLIHKEDSTLVNPIRLQLLNDIKRVSFASSTVPHPLEPTILLTVQTVDGISPETAIHDAVDTQIVEWDNVAQTFDHAVQQFRKK
jgi:DNA-directed RNA polymerase subunit L